MTYHKLQLWSRTYFMATSTYFYNNNWWLRSSSAPSCVVLFTWTEISKRAFQVSTSSVWNYLLSGV